MSWGATVGEVSARGGVPLHVPRGLLLAAVAGPQPLRTLTPQQHRLLADIRILRLGESLKPGSDAYEVLALVSLGLMRARGHMDGDEWLFWPTEDGHALHHAYGAPYVPRTT